MSKPFLPADLHVHTLGSYDGTASASVMAEAAARRGVLAVTLTEHYDAMTLYPPDVFYGEGGLALYSLGAVRDSHRAAADGSPIPVLHGIEIGNPTCDPAAFRSITSRDDFDLVICDVHNLPLIPGEKDDVDLFWVEYDAANTPRYISRYLQTCLDTARFGGFDLFAHILYPFRYIAARGVAVDMRPLYADLSEIFRTLALRNIALEINTKALLSPLASVDPPLELLRLYRSCGGEAVGFGSDAHCPGKVGLGFAEAREVALAAGIRLGVYYVDRKPVYYSLED